MPHDGRGPDLSFLDEKLNLGTCTYDIWLARFDKETTQA
jgi:hypothetical protein